MVLLRGAAPITRGAGFSSVPGSRLEGKALALALVASLCLAPPLNPARVEEAARRFDMNRRWVLTQLADLEARPVSDWNDRTVLRLVTLEHRLEPVFKSRLAASPEIAEIRQRVVRLREELHDAQEVLPSEGALHSLAADPAP
jgi:hypothetical protein